ncbi:MAG: AhpC/TSA family protein [Acidobacteriota bacterium]
MFCREQVAQLRPRVGDIRRLGAELVLVGNGSAAQAAAFVKEQGLDVPVFTDPSLAVYKAAGLARNVLGVFGPSSAVAAAKTTLKGFLPTGIQGDALQLGGTFIVMPGGRIPWSYTAKHAGNHPTPDQVIAALGRVLAA